MAAGVLFTLSEACEILNPPLSENQLAAIIRALRWQPSGQRRTGRPGHPVPTYPAGEIFALHAAIVPFLHSLELAQNRL